MVVTLNDLRRDGDGGSSDAPSIYRGIQRAQSSARPGQRGRHQLSPKHSSSHQRGGPGTKAVAFAILLACLIWTRRALTLTLTLALTLILTLTLALTLTL
jgi:hypothetical protein